MHDFRDKHMMYLREENESGRPVKTRCGLAWRGLKLEGAHNEGESD